MELTIHSAGSQLSSSVDRSRSCQRDTPPTVDRSSSLRWVLIMKSSIIYLILSVIPGILFLHANGHMTTTAIIEAIIFIGLCPLLTLVGIVGAVRSLRAKALYVLGALVSALPGMYLLLFVANWGRQY